MNLNELKEIYLKGEKISFDIVNHPKIPNIVYVGNSMYGKVSISTINAFNKWKDKNKQ